VIKSDQELEVTRTQVARFQKALAEFDDEPLLSGMRPDVREAARDALQSQLAGLVAEVAAYTRQQEPFSRVDASLHDRFAAARRALPNAELYPHSECYVRNASPEGSTVIFRFRKVRYWVDGTSARSEWGWEFESLTDSSLKRKKGDHA